MKKESTNRTERTFLACIILEDVLFWSNIVCAIVGVATISIVTVFTLYSITNLMIFYIQIKKYGLVTSDVRAFLFFTMLEMIPIIVYIIIFWIKKL